MQQSARTKDAELADLRGRFSDVEKRLSKDQRQLQSQENQYRDQLTERNTLLLTIYQYLEKILGADKTPVRRFVSIRFASLTRHRRIEEGREYYDEAVHRLCDVP